MRPANPYDSTRWGLGAFLSLPVPAAAVFIWRESWWPLAVFVVWTAGAALLYAVLLRRMVREQNIRMMDRVRKTAIKTLSHHRHDWMNDLQILYGYLTLNKPDKAVGVVGRIRERMENDSKVSQLGNARLATFLLSFRALCDHMKLDVRIDDGLSLDLPGLDPDKLTDCLIGLINAFRFRSASPSSSGENVLYVRMFMAGDALSVEMVYEGEWASGKSLSEEAANLLDGLGQWTEEEEAGTQAGMTRRAVAVFRPSA